jgi:hypothetical protein
MPRKSKEAQQIDAAYARMQEKQKRRSAEGLASTGKFTFDIMKLGLVTGWGALGARTADTWAEFNQTYFAGQLKPLPIFFTQVSPYGHWLGLCSCSSESRTICLCRPRETTQLRADKGVLLHEMIHQHLTERGESPAHKDQPWRDEIARLTLQITGKLIVASAQKVTKIRQQDGTRKSVRVQADEASLGQKQIARWPHSIGLELGEL